MKNNCKFKNTFYRWSQNTFPMIKNYFHYGSQISIPKKTILLTPGAPVKKVYYVLSGSLKCSLVHDDGREKILAILGPGSFIMEGLLANDKSSIFLKAREKCSLITFTHEQIKYFAAKDSQFSYALLNFLHNKYNMLMLSYQNFLFIPTSHRLCCLLCILADNFGIKKDNETTITLRITQNEMAKILSVSRVTISNIFRDLREKKIVKMKGREISISNNICEYCQSTIY